MTNVENEQLRARVREIVGEMSPLGKRTADSADVLTDDLGYDSLAMIELSLRMESAFSLTSMDQSKAMDIKTVKDVEDLVESMAAVASDAA